MTRGIFVVTKADLVNADRLKEVRDEIELLADGTQLAAAPTIFAQRPAGTL